MLLELTTCVVNAYISECIAARQNNKRDHVSVQQAEQERKNERKKLGRKTKVTT